MPSHYLNWCWNIVNSNPRNKFQWNLKWNSYIFIQENLFKNVICDKATILLRPQCVNGLVKETCWWYIVIVITGELHLLCTKSSKCNVSRWANEQVVCMFQDVRHRHVLPSRHACQGEYLAYMYKKGNSSFILYAAICNQLIIITSTYLNYWGMRQLTRSPLIQIMACHLTPSRYLNRSWLIVNWTLRNISW